MNRVVAGTIAGAAATTVINTATNLDMVLRGRPPSQVPEGTVEPLAEDLGIVGAEPHDGRDIHRLTGLGAVGGTATGVATGVACALIRPRVHRLPVPVAGVAVGLAAMALTDTSATIAGATDPRTWSASAWLSDLVPHLLFGWATVALVDLLDARG